MTDSDAVRKVKRMFRNLGAPPPPLAAVGNLARPAPEARERSERTEQLNLRVPPGLKKRVRRLAMRDDITIAEVIIRAVALYEKRHGEAPEV